MCLAGQMRNHALPLAEQISCGVACVMCMIEEHNPMHASGDTLHSTFAFYGHRHLWSQCGIPWAPIGTYGMQRAGQVAEHHGLAGIAPACSQDSATVASARSRLRIQLQQQTCYLFMEEQGKSRIWVWQSSVHDELHVSICLERDTTTSLY